MLSVSEVALQQLSALLLERVGLKITPDGYHSLKLALSARMPALGVSDAEEYVQRLREIAGEAELRALLPLVTVGHTEFFRDPKQFRALEQRVLPELLTLARREARKVNIWSAGCATGEEPYSLAIVLSEIGAAPHEVDLWATDLNLAAVENAKLGRFSRRRVGGMAPARLKRFFQPHGDGYEILPFLREYIRFEGQNLAAPVFPKVKTGTLDLILCRNVIIYFDLPTIRGLMDRFLSALRPGGLLFLGYSESLFKVYEHFETVDVEGAFVYRRPLKGEAVTTGLRPLPPGAVAGEQSQAARLALAEQALRARISGERRALGQPSTRTSSPEPRPASGGERPPPAETAGRAGAPAPTPAAAPVARASESYPVVKTPARGTDVTQLRPPAPSAPAASSSPPERLDAAVRLMDSGDFTGALEKVTKLLDDEPGDLDALLTWGNINALLGRNAEARAAFAQVLVREPLCVEARVFGAIAALQVNDLGEAKAELSKALFLEPTLAVGHYLLAQVEERRKERDAARRAYRNAIAQLRFPQRALAGHYPEMPDSADAIARAARYALAALEEHP